MLETIKIAITVLGLRDAVLSMLRAYGTVFPRHRVKRRGVRYSLDLREVIDFATYFGGWEPETIRFIDQSSRPGDVVLEVGANVGIQTLHIASRVQPGGHVYAFEPTRFALDKLASNLDLNPRLQNSVTVIPKLVTNDALAVPVSTVRSSYRTNSVSAMADEVIDHSKAISVDQFVESEGLMRVDLIKVDVDGYDLKVLVGGRRTIDKFRPLIYVELDEDMLGVQGDSVRDIFNFLTPRGYEGYLATTQSKVTDIDELIGNLKGKGHANAIFRARSSR